MQHATLSAPKFQCRLCSNNMPDDKFRTCTDCRASFRASYRSGKRAKFVREIDDLKISLERMTRENRSLRIKLDKLKGIQQ